MRVAYVIAPASAQAEVPVSIVVLRERLVLSGFHVVNLTTCARLAQQVATASAMAGVDDSILLYLAAATRLDDEGTVRLRLDDDEAIPLAPLGEVIRALGAREVFYFVDAQHDGMADDVMRAAEHVEAIAAALGVREAGHGLLVGAHAPADGAAAWPLTQFYADVLDEPGARSERGDLVASRVSDRVRADATLSQRMPSFAHFKGGADFVLDVAPIPAPTPSRRPPPSSMRPPPSSEPHRSLRPLTLPALDPILLAAAEAREMGQWDRALEEYKRALMVVPAGDATAKASIYGYIGEVKRAQGKAREAELNFEKALREAPGHRRSLEALVAIATEHGEWRRVAEHRRALAAALEDPQRRASELIKLASVAEKELAEPDAAIRALEEAYELAPHDTGVLQKLRALYEAAAQWPKLANALGALADGEGAAGAARAELRFAQADVTLARLRDEARGCALLERALEDDPTHEKALFALTAVRTRRNEHAELDAALLPLAERLGARGEREKAGEVCKRLAVLRRDRLRDPEGAIEAYRAALGCTPADGDARAMLAELLVSKGEVEAATRELVLTARHAPLRAATYKRLFELHHRAGRADRAWLAAIALGALGAAEVDHELYAEQMKTTSSALRPQAVLDDDAWRKLAAPGVDPVVGAILRAILPAATAMRVEDLRENKQLVGMDPKALQPKDSTATVVRSFAWAGQVLSIELPELYVLDEVPGGVAAVQGDAPRTALGPSVLTGLGLPALAFVAARHLTYYKKEHYALVLYPTVADLSALVLAAVKLAMPTMAASRSIQSGAKRLEKALGRAGAGDAQKKELEAAVRALAERGGKMDLASFVRGVELSAHRAGLLVCGDLAVALQQIEGEGDTRRIAELSTTDKRGDLIGWCASDELAELRVKLGVAARV